MIIDIILPLSLIFIMFSLGLGLNTDDFKNIVNYPKAFFVGILNQMIILPIVAFFLIIIFKLSGELAVGMMILSCCPGGVTSNIITRMSNGDTALSISYTAFVKYYDNVYIANNSIYVICVFYGNKCTSNKYFYAWFNNVCYNYCASVSWAIYKFKIS